ncbi:MAG TPA: hypothetical protein VLJ42_13540 [Solirubrobacteraceae bacterium]|nr:hypothetical protein [Solirubrobacteraceae bacterium]
MSSPILPPQGPFGPTASRLPAHTQGGKRPAASSPTQAAQAGAHVGAAVSLDTFPSSPPAQVLDEIKAAGESYDRLQAHGRELCFSPDEQSGELTIKVRDLDGNTLRTVSASEAVDIAAGKSPA